jgi:hypothetical protein
MAGADVQAIRPQLQRKGRGHRRRRSAGCAVHLRTVRLGRSLFSGVGPRTVAMDKDDAPRHDPECHNDGGNAPGNRRTLPMVVGGSNRLLVAGICSPSGPGPARPGPALAAFRSGPSRQEKLRRNRRLSSRCSAVAQIVHQLGRPGRIDAAMDQRRDDFIIGTLSVPQPSSEFDIRPQNVVCHGCGELLYRQSGPCTSQDLG